MNCTNFFYFNNCPLLASSSGDLLVYLVYLHNNNNNHQQLAPVHAAPVPLSMPFNLLLRVQVTREVGPLNYLYYIYIEYFRTTKECECNC